jgi:hypothetical protein
MRSFSTDAPQDGKTTGPAQPLTPLPPQNPGHDQAEGPTTNLQKGSEAEAAATNPATLGSEPRVLEPLGPPQPRRKIDLLIASLPEPGPMVEVELLVVKELMGTDQLFTPNLSAMLCFQGLVYKPQNKYEKQYQIIAPPLNNDPRVMRRATIIAFTPAYSWSTFEVVLRPVRLSIHGRRVLDDLLTLKPTSLHHKVYVVWDETKSRHVVGSDQLSEQERSIIDGVKWPSKERILETLQAIAFDNLEDLIGANEQIRTLVTFKEVR